MHPMPHARGMRCGADEQAVRRIGFGAAATCSPELIDRTLSEVSGRGPWCAMRTHGRGRDDNPGMLFSATVL